MPGDNRGVYHTVAIRLGGVVGLLVRYPRILWTIVRFCAVFGCINRSNHETDKRFIIITAIIIHSDQKTHVLRRDGVTMAFGDQEARFNDLTGDKIRHAAVCIDHFISGKVTRLQLTMKLHIIVGDVLKSELPFFDVCIANSYRTRSHLSCSSCCCCCIETSMGGGCFPKLMWPKHNIINQKVKVGVTNNDKRAKSWCGTGKVGMAMATPAIQHSPPMETSITVPKESVPATPVNQLHHMTNRTKTKPPATASLPPANLSPTLPSAAASTGNNTLSRTCTFHASVRRALPSRAATHNVTRTGIYFRCAILTLQSVSSPSSLLPRN